MESETVVYGIFKVTVKKLFYFSEKSSTRYYNELSLYALCKDVEEEEGNLKYCEIDL